MVLTFSYQGSANLPSVSNSHKTSEIAVSVRGLGLTYTTAIDRRPTLKARVKALGGGGKQTRVIRALDNVNLDVEYGQVLGVIGSNGAGKSTLMRVIAGILPPSQGRIEVHGSVSTLLALGVGFNPSMSGRDNVFLGGLAAGMRREEIENSFAEIAEFSELGDAIDAPMRTYSSGMFARLAFSVAATVRPDILIIDEALSTGDAKFKEKSLNRIKELRSDDRALILVSHAMATLRDVCNDVVWIHKGKVIQRGEPNVVIDAYQEFLKVGKSAVIDEDF
ncbi:MAG: ATP-binding cassette domain-containing protein [Actinobacteria bacterium]|nr:ATP-binding cassette domain-containing protein [Actinomycetota bacterium]MSY35324.1 ATP-binding cassette domain-containing protein [Actinomycetota bacterium]MTA71889.1 ATP-binding cassette domain-containing protein [Actinomycetota bacterium]MTB28886.1 ATP-binding cassette domain-containing protein [Actinomycetota bacterium]MUH48355.1 ATP-binding cassette domain-containing protein [Actinomycetota bacterium]